MSDEHSADNAADNPAANQEPRTPRQAESTEPGDAPSLLTETRLGYARGWSYTPLNGKIPILTNWQRQPRADLPRTLRWASAGNVGVRTGEASGVVVVDVDPGGVVPETVTPTASTPRGGRHLYFRYPGPTKNSVGKLSDHVDVRADGGQVVSPGCQGYQWLPGLSPADVSMAELPAWVTATPTQTPRPRTIHTAAPNGTTNYGTAALDREAAVVRDSRPGTRRDTLNRAAFSLAGLIPTGDLTADQIFTTLHSSAPVAEDFPESEITATITAAIRDGSSKPRAARPTLPTTIRVIPRTAAPSPSPVPAAAAPIHPPTPDLTILIPGGHTTDEATYYEVGTDDFAESVLTRLPANSLYRFCGAVGEVVGEPGAKRFEPASADRLRLMIDAAMRLSAWRTDKQSGEQRIRFVPASRDHGALALAAAQSSAHIPEIITITPYPVFTADFQLSPPGYSQGVYYDEPEELRNLHPEHEQAIQRETLADLAVDFPFATPADRQAFYGLLLTPLLRPAIAGNVPMHLIVSSIERTGKTKLAEEVLGGITMGRPTPPIQVGGSDDERDKRILSLLLGGATVVHLDNISAYLDSPSLASVLTASSYQGRVLGASRVVTAPNTMTVVATGNNVHASSEIVKRTIPIILQPKSDSPEDRIDFRHPDLRGYIAQSRRRVLETLIGMVQAWHADGARQGHIRVGGFEVWAGVVQGVLAHTGWARWGENLKAWRQAADDDSGDLEAFVGAWRAKYGAAWVNSTDLMVVAEECGSFIRHLSDKNPKARMTRFGARVMAKLENRVVGASIIRRERKSTGTVYALDQLAKA